MVRENPETSIVIVNYNSFDDLKLCINSIIKNSYKDYEIVIVDNEGNSEIDKLRNKKIRIIKSKFNSGYAGGNNLGIKNAYGKYICILNPDIEIEKNSLKKLVNIMKKNKIIKLCQPKILLKENRSLINTDGNKAHYLGFGYCGNYGKLDSDKNIGLIEVPYTSGACFIAEKRVLAKLNMFDKDFFMYHEDFDLGVRARLNGYKVMVYKDSKVYHNYRFSKNGLKNYHIEKNRLISIFKTYEFKTILVILPVFLLTEMAVIFLSIKQFWFREKLRSYFFILLNLRKILKKRCEIQRHRKIKDVELFVCFANKIDFPLLNPICMDYFNYFTDKYYRLLKKVIR